MPNNNRDRNNRLQSVYRALIPVALGAVLIVLVFVLQQKQGKEEYPDFDEASEIQENPEPDIDQIVNGIHVRTGFVDDEGLMTVVANCTACHSASLVTQNRMSREGWEGLIRWMQETQNLWDLGPNESVILDYLAANYAPKKKGRRQQLTGIEWYELDLETSEN
ncbi:MAG: hypothetical protein RLZZ241_2322 [Bacteroidota bacterium]|jgi:hypothetical protein